jgi:2-dehydropantoate 2-reductase
MKTVVLGAGALGSILAAHLARAGEDVTLLARGARAKLLAERGLTIRGVADFTVPLRVVEDPKEVTDADLLIVTVKTYDTDAALAPLRHVRAKSVISVQNGLMKNDQLADVFGRGAVLGCAANFSGEVEADGTTHFTRNNDLLIGELPSGTSQRVDDIVAMMDAGGVKCSAVANIQTVEWSKFVAWLALTPAAVLTRLPTHRVLQDRDLALLQVQLVREAAQLAERLGIPLDDSLMLAPGRLLSTLPIEDAVAQQVAYGRDMEGQGVTTHKMSALQDVERGRRLEVEETVGWVVRKAAKLGVDVPRIDACYRMMAALSRAAT